MLMSFELLVLDLGTPIGDVLCASHGPDFAYPRLVPEDPPGEAQLALEVDCAMCCRMERGGSVTRFSRTRHERDLDVIGTYYVLCALGWSTT